MSTSLTWEWDNRCESRRAGWSESSSRRSWPNAWGVSRVSVTKWEDDDTIKITGENLYNLADALQCTAEWILDGVNPPSLVPGDRPRPVIPASDKVFVNRVSGIHVAAGSGAVIYDFEELDDSHSFRREWMQKEGLEPAHCKLVEVKGDSMFPTLNDGETIMVNTRERDPKHNRIYVLITEDGLRVKRLMQRSDKTWEIHSDNQAKHLYPTEPLVPLGRSPFGAAFAGTPAPCSPRHVNPACQLYL